MVQVLVDFGIKYFYFCIFPLAPPWSQLSTNVVISSLDLMRLKFKLLTDFIFLFCFVLLLFLSSFTQTLWPIKVKEHHWSTLQLMSNVEVMYFGGFTEIHSFKFPPKYFMSLFFTWLRDILRVDKNIILILSITLFVT